MMGIELTRYNDIKDTRRYWGDIDPRQFVGGLVYDVNRHDIGMVACDASEYDAPWRRIYLYTVNVGDDGFVYGSGTFAHMLVPIAPPYVAHWLVAEFPRQMLDAMRHKAMYRDHPADAHAESSAASEMPDTPHSDPQAKCICTPDCTPEED